MITRDGPLDPCRQPGEVVVNIGDMLQRLTNGVLAQHPPRRKPKTERKSHARYSMPLFLHFHPEFLIEALPQTVAAGEGATKAAITAHDFSGAMREIKLK